MSSTPTDDVDALGELYRQDTMIDEQFALAASENPAFDEDTALEAYEELIFAAGRDSDDARDAAMGLAAQLLQKHFVKFPHVQLNVVKALVELASTTTRPMVVRLHAVHALIGIARSGAALTDASREHFATCVAQLVKETTNGRKRTHVLASHVDVLKRAFATWEKQQSEAPKPEPGNEPTALGPPVPSGKENMRSGGGTSTPPRDARANGAKSPERTDRERSSSRMGHDDNGGRRERSYGTRDDRPSYDRRPSATEGLSSGPPPTGPPPSTNSQSCPPGPFMFMGGLPRPTSQDEILEFLDNPDPTLTPSAVQIKFPGNRSQAGYAFVSFSTVAFCREAIHHVKTHKFQGRSLIGDFARGPPCPTVLFVERQSPERTMLDENAIRDVDFGVYAPTVWRELCRLLERYGPFEILYEGRLRFREIEDAKSVIRAHHFIVEGKEILPIYDTEEQLSNDGARRRRTEPGFRTITGHGGVDRRPSGRFGSAGDKYDGHYHHHREHKSYDRDGGDRDRKRPRSRSPDDRERSQRTRRDDSDHHHQQHRRDDGGDERYETDVGRYGPDDNGRDYDRRGGGSSRGGGDDGRGRGRESDREYVRRPSGRSDDHSRPREDGYDRRRSRSPVAPRPSPRESSHHSRTSHRRDEGGDRRDSYVTSEREERGSRRRSVSPFARSSRHDDRQERHGGGGRPEHQHSERYERSDRGFEDSERYNRFDRHDRRDSGNRPVSPAGSSHFGRPGSSSFSSRPRKSDDRSIAEIAREQQERFRQLQLQNAGGAHGHGHGRRDREMSGGSVPRYGSEGVRRGRSSRSPSPADNREYRDDRERGGPRRRSQSPQSRGRGRPPTPSNDDRKYYAERHNRRRSSDRRDYEERRSSPSGGRLSKHGRLSSVSPERRGNSSERGRGDNRSPSPTTAGERGGNSNAYDNIDECTVDYEEEEE